MVGRFDVRRVAPLVVLAGLVLGAVPLDASAAGRRAAAMPAATAASPGNATTVALDLDSLETRLRDTKAIGLMTKLSLKNQVDDLLEQFREYHDGEGGGPLPRLRERFDLLILKVLSLLQKRDPGLAHDISASREALWALLVDPRKFSTLRTHSTLRDERRAGA